MADLNPRPLQLFVKLLDGRSRILEFPSSHVYGHQIKRQIFELTKIPTDLQRLICGGYQISDTSVVSLPDSTVNLVLPLRGGKGGFGSLLRGAATKAGQKKTNNFDACRDMSGRRLRHVNAEKKLEEWKAEEEERKLEKLAQEFLKKQAKKGKQGVGGAGEREAQKYVEKYRKESEKCIEAVEMALKESFQNGKRKGKIDAESDKSKRLKIWMGKRVMGDSDSDDSSDEEGEGEDDKSVVLNNGSQVSSDKDTEGSSGSVMEAAQTEEDCIGHHNSAEITGVEPEIIKEKSEANEAEKGKDLSNGERKKTVEEPSKPSSSLVNDEIKETNSVNHKIDQSPKPFTFDDFNSAAEMENLGMDRLKMELQAKGLKCGGTLQERAARLFLLKSTPLDKIPKKLLAKK